MSTKQSAEKHGLDKEEPGKIQILPDFLSLQPPEGRDFYSSGGGEKGCEPSQNYLAHHLELVSIASWICLSMPCPLKCQGLCRKDGGSKRFPDQPNMINGSQRKTQYKIGFPQVPHQTPSDPGFLETRTGLPAGLKVLESRTMSSRSDRELNEGKVQASSIRASRSHFFLLPAHL